MGEIGVGVSRNVMEKDDTFLTLVRFHKTNLPQTIFEMLKQLDEGLIVRSTKMRYAYLRRHGEHVFFCTKGLGRRSPWMLGRINLSDEVGVFEYGVSQFYMFIIMVVNAFVFALAIGSVPEIWSWPLILGVVLFFTIGFDYLQTGASVKDAELLFELILEKDDSLYMEMWNAD